MVSTARRALPDKVIMYASVFSYVPTERNKINSYKINESKISQFESKFV